MEKRVEKKPILLLDMYGVIIKESKGNFIPYTFAHFEKNEHERLKKAFRQENLFTKAGNGELCSDKFLSLLGYTNPTETMQDYLTNHLTFDEDFLQFAECNYQQYDFVLLSNDVKEWSSYLFALYGLHKYFRNTFVSGELHLRKPQPQIFLHTIEHMQCKPQECIFVDNSVQNLNAAQAVGINTVLFNRDREPYSGNIVNTFQELDRFLKTSDLVQGT